MFRNYLKMAWKVLKRRKFFTFVSLFGIAFTLAALLVVVALGDHFLAPSYPETQLDRTLTFNRAKMFGDRSNWFSGPGFKTIDRYTRELPGVERMSVYSRASDAATFVRGRKLTFETRFADAEYWRILQFEFLEGAPFDANDDLNASHVAVISDGARERLFGDEPGLGKSVELDAVTYRIIGVVRDVPWYRATAASEVWLPLHNQRAAGFFDRLMGGCEAIYLLEPGADPGQVKAAFAERLTRVEFDDPEHFHTMGGMPMNQLELLSHQLLNLEPGESAPRELILVAILAVLVFMALPAINLVNINLSRIYERSSEIGVRKAFGAASRHLVMQFVVENVFLSLIGAMIGLAAAYGILQLSTKFPWYPFLEFSMSWRIFAAAVVLAIVFGLLSGVWPAWKMSRQHPVAALRGGTS